MDKGSKLLISQSRQQIKSEGKVINSVFSFTNRNQQMKEQIQRDDQFTLCP